MTAPDPQEVTRLAVVAFTATPAEIDHLELEAWRRILSQLSDDEARLLPRAMSDAVMSLVATASMDRVRAAIRLCVSLDLVESIGVLGFLTEQYHLTDALIAACILATNPAVAADLVVRVGSLVDAEELTPRQRALCLAMLEGDVAQPTTLASEGLAIERWPGRFLREQYESPFVAVDCAWGYPTRAIWQTMGDLVAAGAIVRRRFAVSDRDALWLPAGLVSIGSTLLPALPTSHYVPVVSSEFEFSGSAPVMARVAESLAHEGLPALYFTQESPGETVASYSSENLQIGEFLMHIKRLAFTAVETAVDQLIDAEPIEYDELLSVARVASENDPRFYELLTSISDTIDPYEHAIFDGVAAAIAQLTNLEKISLGQDGRTVEALH